MAACYQTFRPSYPETLLSILREALIVEPPSDGAVVDVGCGTGIFTRQLRETLLASMPVIGVEPGADMRNTAIESSGGYDNLSFVDGAAESLPFPEDAARAVLTATAAHWFDRPAFYAEAARILLPHGILCIVDYVRDVEASPPAKALIDMMAAYGQRRRDTRPDYAAELASLPHFGAVETYAKPAALDLSEGEYVGLALSSSYAKPIVASFGRAEIERQLFALARKFASLQGRIAYGYICRACWARCTC